MADLSDVDAQLVIQAAAAVYPNGINNPPVAGAKIQIMEGWPLDSDLDALVASFNGNPSTANILISVYPRPGMYRNTSRYFSRWIEVSRPADTLLAVAFGTRITISGTAPGTSGPVQNVAAIVGFGSGHQAFVYQTTTTDTLATIAAALAALINVATPATATGAVIRIPASFSIIARIGVIGIVARELRRQLVRIDINIWAPSPALRDQVSIPIREAFAHFDYVVLPDQFAARVRACDDHWMDDPEKVGLYRRMLGFDVDYPTTESKPATEIIVFESQTTAGVETEFTWDDPDLTWDQAHAAGNSQSGPLTWDEVGFVGGDVSTTII